MRFYFSYGSNICVPHFQAYLENHEIDSAETQDSRRAILSGYRFRTNYRSVTHGAGAANIEPAPGQTVEGVLIELTEIAHQALRAKEGWPVRYKEIEVEVRIIDTDALMLAFTFAVTPGLRLDHDLPVTRRYRDMILEGSTHFDFSQSYQRRLRQVLRPSNEQALIHRSPCLTLNRSKP